MILFEITVEVSGNKKYAWWGGLNNLKKKKKSLSRSTSVVTIPKISFPQICFYHPEVMVMVVVCYQSGPNRAAAYVHIHMG